MNATKELTKSAIINAAIKRGRDVCVRVPGLFVDFIVLSARTKAGKTQVRFEDGYFDIGDAVAYSVGKYGRTAKPEPLW